VPALTLRRLKLVEAAGVESDLGVSDYFGISRFNLVNIGIISLFVFRQKVGIPNESEK